jgi:queuosine precursor transporter
MINEFIFTIHCFLCAAASVIALALGPYALCSLVAFQCVLSNLLVLKQAVLFRFVATCADPFTIGATLGLNLLQEFYGKAVAKKAIIITFFLLLFYTVMTYVHVWYIPAAVDIMHNHYQALFATTPRIACASLFTYSLVQWLDYLIYGFLKGWLHNRFIHVRSFVSIVICQAVDTVLFTFLGLGNIVERPWDVIVVSYSIKLLAAIFGIVFIKLISLLLGIQRFKRRGY